MNQTERRERRKAIADFVQQNPTASYDDVAKQFKVSITTVTNSCKEFKVIPSLSALDRAKILVATFKSTNSLLAAREASGISDEHARKILRGEGIVLSKKAPTLRRQNPRISRDVMLLADIICHPEMTQMAIAVKHGVEPSRVSDLVGAARYLGIPLTRKDKCGPRPRLDSSQTGE